MLAPNLHGEGELVVSDGDLGDLAGVAEHVGGEVLKAGGWGGGGGGRGGLVAIEDSEMHAHEMCMPSLGPE